METTQVEELEAQIAQAKSIEDPTERKKALRKLRKQLKSALPFSPPEKPDQTREGLLSQLEDSGMEKISGYKVVHEIGHDVKKYERGYGCGVNLSVSEGVTAQDLIEKFEERWGEKPSWYYFSPDDPTARDFLILLGPLPKN